MIYLEGSKVDNTVNGRMLGKDVVNGLLVRHINLVKVGATATQKLNAIKGDF